MSSDIVVLGNGALREVGEPRRVDISGDVVAVAGSMGVPQWAGASLERVVGGSGWERVGVYDRANLECRLLVPLRWPVNALAFDPAAKYLAIGAGSYDGGWCYEGELVLVDLERGDVVSLLREEREVVGLSWAADGAIEIVVSPATDEDDPEPRLFRIPHELWADFGRKSVSLAEMESVACEPPQAEFEVAHQLGEIASSAGQSHAVRRQVWDVDVDASGEVSACLEGVRLEIWDSSGERKFFEPTDGRGCQLVAVGDDLVLAVVEPPWGPPETGFARQPSSIEVLDRKNGRRVRHVEVSYPAAAFASKDGRFILRNVNWNTRDESESLFFADVAGDAEPVVVGGYDFFNHSFRIRRAPDVLLLVGDRGQPSRNKWVARVVREERRFGRRSTTAIQRLFPLEWDANRDAHIMGGPGCWMADGREPSLVHSGWLHDGRGLLGGNSFLVCRSGRSGEPQWEYRASAQFSGVDVIDGDVWATLMSGELVRLDASNGEVLDETALEVNGHPVVPLSLSGDAGWLAIGLLDGRILRIEV